MKLKAKIKSAFSLVEVTLALGICSFCLISLVALIPSGLTAAKNASSMTTATNIASSILSDLQSNVVTITNTTTGATSQSISGNTPVYDIPTGSASEVFNFVPIPATIPKDGINTENWTRTTGAGLYRVTVRTNPTPSSAGPYTFTVKVSWPGGTSSTANIKPQGSITLVGRSSSLFRSNN